jgi:hypothetical protein
LNGTWSNVSSGNSASYSAVFTQLGSFQYRVIVTQGTGCLTVSAPLTITVVANPVVTITASATQICTGGTVTITSTVNGSFGTGTYQWQRFVSGSWTNVGTNSSSFTTPVLTTGTYNYRLLYSEGSGCTAESNAVSIQVVNDPAATISASPVLVCEGSSVTINSTVTGGFAPFNYHWQLLVASVWTDVGIPKTPSIQVLLQQVHIPIDSILKMEFLVRPQVILSLLQQQLIRQSPLLQP